MTDLPAAFHEVVRVANEATSAEAGLREVMACAQRLGGNAISELSRVDILADIASVREQIQAVLAAEPPPAELQAIYFGLFDTEHDGREEIGYYLCGVERFDPDDPDALCHPEWLPDERLLESRALGAVKHAELAAAAVGDDRARELLAYAGELGVAAIVSRFGSAGLFPGKRLLVGFDSGDFAEVENVEPRAQ